MCKSKMQMDVLFPYWIFLRVSMFDVHVYNTQKCYLKIPFVLTF